MVKAAVRDASCAGPLGPIQGMFEPSSERQDASCLVHLGHRGAMHILLLRVPSVGSGATSLSCTPTSTPSTPLSRRRMPSASMAAVALVLLAGRARLNVRLCERLLQKCRIAVLRPSAGGCESARNCFL